MDQFRNKDSKQYANTERQANNSGMSFVIRKGEKLTTALYMVTDIMSEKEPMKWKLRENGIELISDIAVSFGAPASERMSVLRDAIKKIEKVISYLEIAQTARMISEMNASVLKKEYANFKEQVEREWNETYEKSKNIFSTSFFDVPREVPERLSERVSEVKAEPIREVSHANQSEHERPQVAKIVQFAHTNTADQRTTEEKHQEKNQAEHRSENGARPTMEPSPSLRTQLLSIQNGVLLHQAGGTPPSTARNTPAAPTGNASQHSQPQTNMHARPQYQPQHMQKVEPKTESHQHTNIERKEVFVRVPQEVGRGDRRDIILSLIKQKPSLNIKDIVKSIPDVSEKTVQRELLAMVATGILVKRGERRWSTYSLRES